MNQFKLLALFILFGAIQISYGKKPKKDYLKHKEKYMELNCEKYDSLTAVKSIEKLLSIDSSGFTKNFHYYYNDLAWAYYIYYAHTKDYLYLRKAIENYHKVVDITKEYWNIAFCYIYIEDCENGKMYLEKYKENTKKKHIDNHQISQLLQKCNL